jgi:hypothetical protein
MLLLLGLANAVLLYLMLLDWRLSTADCPICMLHRTCAMHFAPSELLLLLLPRLLVLLLALAAVSDSLLALLRLPLLLLFLLLQRLSDIRLTPFCFWMADCWATAEAAAAAAAAATFAAAALDLL